MEYSCAVETYIIGMYLYIYCGKLCFGDTRNIEMFVTPDLSVTRQFEIEYILASAQAN